MRKREKKGEIKMKSQELLNNIYDESKAMNRNMQRLRNIGLIGVILNISRGGSCE